VAYVDNGQGRRRPWTEIWLPALLLGLAGLGWWWSVASTAGMRGDAMPMDARSTTSLAAFLIAWVAIMAAMMLPAVLPVVGGYVRAAAGNAAEAIVFVAGYLAVWSVIGIPAFLASTRLNPLLHSCPWVGRVAGAVALLAGLHQLTPLKATCLRHCRWPMSLSGGPGKRLKSPAGAFVAGGRYGIYCLGSCWMLMLLLIALGTMQLAWMLALAVVIWLEKVTPFGDQLRRPTAAMLVVLGVVLLVYPTLVTHLIA
jgi:predicted metal-binding membrane protein